MENAIIIGINICDHGSTGLIMRNALEYANKAANFDYLIAVPRSEGKPNTFQYTYRFSRIKSFLYKKVLKIEQRLPVGFYYTEYTRRLIRRLKKERRAHKHLIVHLHNLHTGYLNVGMLIRYLKRSCITTFYTMHDCWQFGGGCFYSDSVKCDKWETGCQPPCPHSLCHKLLQPNAEWKKKKRWFDGFNTLHLLPVSKWIEQKIKLSFLKNNQITIIHGECNLYPTLSADRQLKTELGVGETTHIFVTVSAYWNFTKGADYLYQISEKLPKGYLLLVIGGVFDTKGLNNIMHIGPLSEESLPRYLGISDVFLNVSRADNLPLVLMEAQLCGLPIVGFGNGGTPEEIIEGETGTMLNGVNDVSLLVQKAIEVAQERPFSKEKIVNNGKHFQKYSCAKRYLKLYLQAINESAPCTD